MPRLSRLCALLFLFFLVACNSAPADPTAAPAPVPPTHVPTAAPRPTATPAITAIAQPAPPPSALVLWAVAEEPRLSATRWPACRRPT